MVEARLDNVDKGVGTGNEFMNDLSDFPHCKLFPICVGRSPYMLLWNLGWSISDTNESCTTQNGPVMPKLNQQVKVVCIKLYYLVYRIKSFGCICEALNVNICEYPEAPHMLVSMCPMCNTTHIVPRCYEALETD